MYRNVLSSKDVINCNWALLSAYTKLPPEATTSEVSFSVLQLYLNWFCEEMEFEL